MLRLSLVGAGQLNKSVRLLVDARLVVLGTCPCIVHGALLGELTSTVLKQIVSQRALTIGGEVLAPSRLRLLHQLLLILAGKELFLAELVGALRELRHILRL